jgi:hypothetical protein
MNFGRKVAVGVFLVVLVTLGTLDAKPHTKKKPAVSSDDVTVVANKSDHKKPFEIDGIRYTPKECAFVLGELRTTRPATARVLLLVGDDMELGAIADLSQMAVDAGFIHVQAYAYWPRNHSMAEVQFGTVVPAPPQLERKR